MIYMNQNIWAKLNEPNYILVWTKLYEPNYNMKNYIWTKYVVHIIREEISI